MCNSFIGSNIYKKSLFLSCPKDIFVGTHYIHMGISYYILDRSNNFYIIQEPQITQLAPTYKESRSKSGVNVYFEALLGAIKINKNRQIHISKIFNFYLLSNRVSWQSANLLVESHYKLCFSLWINFFHSLPFLLKLLFIPMIFRFSYYLALISLKN